MLSQERASIMQDAALFNDADRYPYVEYLTDLTDGIFEELKTPNASIDPLRRSLQRRYLMILAQNMGAPPVDDNTKKLLWASGLPAYIAYTGDGYVSDYRASGALVLQGLAAKLKQAGTMTTNKETQAHLLECERLARRALLAGETPMK